MVVTLVVSLVAVSLVVILALFPVRASWFVRSSETNTRRERTKFRPARDSFVDEIYDDEEL